MALRADLQKALGPLLHDVLRGTVGESVSYTNKSNTAITLTGVHGGSETKAFDEASGTLQELTRRDFIVPIQAGLFALISNKALTTNVATITTSAAHGFVAGQLVRIVLDTADSVFDGYQIISTAPTSTTFTFAKTNANVTSVAAKGRVMAVVNVGDKITYENSDWEVEDAKLDSIGAHFLVSCSRELPQALGVV